MRGRRRVRCENIGVYVRASVYIVLQWWLVVNRVLHVYIHSCKIEHITNKTLMIAYKILFCVSAILSQQ